MAILSFQDASEVCMAIQNGTNTAWQPLYYTGSLAINTVLYWDSALTQKVSAGVYGIKNNAGTIFYNCTTDSTGAIIALNTCSISSSQPQELTFATPDINEGAWSYYANGQKGVNRSQLSVLETATELIITDAVWDTSNFSERPSEEKVLFLCGTKAAVARAYVFKNLNFEDMRGFDIVAWVGYMNTSDSGKSSTFVNHRIHVGTRAGQNRREWVQGPVKYMFMPSEHNFTSSLLPRWLSTFNNFTLPSTAYFSTQFLVGNQNNVLALQKGNSHTSDANAPQGKRHVYDYDGWLKAAGAPEGDTATNEAWLANVDPNVLLTAFRNVFAATFRQVGAVIMDGEAYGQSNPGPIGGKFDACFKDFKITNPGVLLGWWGEGLFHWSRINIESGNYKTQLTNALNFTGSLNDLAATMTGVLGMGYPAFYENFDILYIASYTNFPTNIYCIEIALIEDIITERYFPNKKRLFSWWELIEYVGGDFLLGASYFKRNNGNQVKYFHKPIVFPHEMWNVGIWFLSRRNCGVDLWGFPHYRIEGDNVNWGWSTGDIRDMTSGETLPDAFKNVNGQTQGSIWYDASSIDWLYAAAKRVSENADIITANTTWTFAETSKDGGANWTTGNQKLPSETMYDENPLADYKLHSNGTEALVKVYCNYGDPLSKKTIKVKIGTAIFDIDVFGRYTTFARITL